MSASDPASWRPLESEKDIMTERGVMNGLVASAGLYGLFVSLYVQTFKHLYCGLRSGHGSSPSNRSLRLFLLVYITIFFILGTLYIISEARVNQFIFIDDRNYPGGPVAFTKEQYSIPTNVLTNVSHVLGTWFADALILGRAIIVYRVSRWYWILILPSLMYIASIGCSIGLMIQITRPKSSLWTSLDFSLPYFILSLALNILLPALLVFRICFLRLRMISLMGKHEGDKYLSVSAIIVESATLVSIFSVLFLVTYVLDYWIQVVWLQVLAMIQLIAPLLIIYRVAQGSAWCSTSESALISTVITLGPSSDLELGRYIEEDTKRNISSRTSGA